jgi:uncharacterized repeat protein (TIGR01451 family)
MVIDPADITLTVDAPATLIAGQQLVYKVHVTNAGPGTAVDFFEQLQIGGIMNITSDNPALSCPERSFSCSAATLAAGASATITYVVYTSPGFSTGGVVSSKALAYASNPDLNPSNNAAIQTTTTFDQSSDAQIIADPPATLANGDVAYTVRVSTKGPSEARNLAISYAVPEDATFVSVVPESSVTCTAPPKSGTGQVACAFSLIWPAVIEPIGPTLNSWLADVVTVVFTVRPNVAGAALTHRATVAMTTPDPVLANNTTSTTATPDVVADLALTMSADHSTVVEATNVVYTINVHNNGPDAVSGAVVTQIIAPNSSIVSTSGAPCSGSAPVTCTLPLLTSGADAQIIVTTAQGYPSAGFTFVSTSARVLSITDPQAANNTASVRVDVTRAPATPSGDLALNLTSDHAVFRSGENIVYTIDIVNNGPDVARGSAISNFLPDGATLVSATGAPCIGIRPLICSLPDLALLATAHVVLTTTQTRVGAVNSYSMIARVASPVTPDPRTGNNSISLLIKVSPDEAPPPRAEVSVSMTATPATLPHGDLSFDIRVTNGGPGAASGVAIDISINGGATLVSMTPGCQGTSTSIFCGGGTLALNETRSFTLVLRAPEVGTNVTATATLTSDNDVDSANNRAVASSMIQPAGPPQLANIHVDVSASPFPRSGPGDFTVTVWNYGPSTSVTTTFSIGLPFGMQSDATLQLTDAACDNVMHCTATKPLAAGGKASVVIHVRRATAGDVIFVVAAGSLPDPDISDNSALLLVTVGNPPANPGRRRTTIH